MFPNIAGFLVAPGQLLLLAAVKAQREYANAMFYADEAVVRGPEKEEAAKGAEKHQVRSVFEKKSIGAEERCMKK